MIVTGIQAAGKSTIGHLLAERLGRAAFIDGDVLSRMVISGRVGMKPDPSPEAVQQLHLRYEQAAMLADSFHRAGFNVVMADNMYGEDLSRQVDRVSASPVLVVVLAPRDEAVLARELARGTNAYRDWMEAQELDAAVAEFQRYLAATHAGSTGGARWAVLDRGQEDGEHKPPTLSPIAPSFVPERSMLTRC